MRAFFLADEKLLALRLGNFAEAGFAPRVAKSKGGHLHQPLDILRVI